jgi:hypothetical protein
LEEWLKIWGRMKVWIIGRLGNEVRRLNPTFQHSNIPLIPTEALKKILWCDKSRRVAKRLALVGIVALAGVVLSLAFASSAYAGVVWY